MLNNFIILEKSTVNNFTSNLGLKIRKLSSAPISFLFNIALRCFYRQKITVDKKIKLPKNKNYIFAANHSFYFDGTSIFASVDRNCYSLFGATEQLYFDFHAFFIWLSGLIYVDRTNPKSRKDSVEKMNRVLKAGNSILIFPEGRWNDSENLLCQKLFAGVYNLSIQNNIEVVPVSTYKENYSNNIYISFGEPLSLYEYNKDTALQILRDNLATMLFEQIEKHSSPFLRDEQKGDIHFNYMEERMFEYSKAKWRSDYCWDDELFTYKSGDVSIDDVWKDIDKVNIDKNNIDKFYDLLIELKRISKYNFTNYMNVNYRTKY